LRNKNPNLPHKSNGPENEGINERREERKV